MSEIEMQELTKLLIKLKKEIPDFMILVNSDTVICRTLFSKGIEITDELADAFLDVVMPSKLKF